MIAALVIRSNTNSMMPLDIYFISTPDDAALLEQKIAKLTGRSTKLAWK
tara:strand:- start:125 stop:271 length:147 start_codon:yes stop_codon:yes gene_type:complete